MTTSFSLKITFITACFAGWWAGKVNAEPALFRRGDVNADWQIDISDPIYALGYLFLGTPPALPCAGAV